MLASKGWVNSHNNVEGTMSLRDYIPKGARFGEEYSNFIAGREYLWNSTMAILNVRDRSGILIRPGPDYASQFHNQDPVSFDVMLRL